MKHPKAIAGSNRRKRQRNDGKEGLVIYCRKYCEKINFTKLRFSPISTKSSARFLYRAGGFCNLSFFAQGDVLTNDE